MTGAGNAAPTERAAAGKRPPSRGARALEWWNRHCHPTTGDAATRARLRRARTPVELVAVDAAVDLARRLGAVPRSDADPSHHLHAALELARVLAHVRENDARHPMVAAGWKHFPAGRKESEAGDDRPLLSEARFRRLLETRDGEQKTLAFIRLIALLGDRVDIETTATDFVLWNHPEHGDRVRECWAFNYFAAGRAAPEVTSTLAEDDDA